MLLDHRLLALNPSGSRTAIPTESGRAIGTNWEYKVLDGLAEEASVYAKVGAGDEAAGSFAGEENGSSDKFPGFTKTLEGGVGEDGLGAGCGRAIGIEQEGAVLFGGEKSGGDGIDADIFRGPLASEELGEVQDSGFGGGVAHHAREGEMSGDAGDVNDGAASAGSHGRTEFLTGQEDSADEVQIEIGQPVFHSNLVDGAFGGDGDFGIVPAGGVHEDGGRAEFFLNVLVSGLEVLLAGNVGREEPSGTARPGDGGDSSVASFGIAAEDGYAGSSGSEAFGESATEHTRGADDNGNVVREIKQVHAGR